MRIADPRIRRVARAIGYSFSHEREQHLTMVRSKIDGAASHYMVMTRKFSRRETLRAAVRVLDALDTDVIGEWEEEYSDRIGIGIVEWAHLRGLPDPPERVHVTVRRHP